MAAVSYKYGKGYATMIAGLLAGDVPIDYLSDTIKTALATSTYTPNRDTHVYFSDVTNEVSGTGYTAGGATLASKTAAYTVAASATAWAAATVYAVGDIVRAVSTNGHVFQCVVAGTSHATTEPTWVTTTHRETAEVSGVVRWVEIGSGYTAVGAANPSWSTSTITARYGVVYKSTGTASTSPLMWLLDLGADYASTASTFQITLATLGIEVFATP